MPILQRQNSLQEFDNNKKRKAGELSPVSVAETVSTTTSPRTMKTPSPVMSLLTPAEATKQLNEYRSGKNVDIPAPIKEIEDERKNIHHSVVDTWTRYPEQREEIRKKSDIIKRLEREAAERRMKEYQALDPIDRPLGRMELVLLEDIDHAHTGQYGSKDLNEFAAREEDNVIFGGKKRKTRKNKKSKKRVKKSKRYRKSMKTKKHNNSRKSKRNHRYRRR